MTNTIEEVDTRLQSALDDERVSRIAGDDANKSLTIQVADQLLNVDSRVSTEIVQRVEGDLGNLNNLNAVSAALAAYRLKSELELNDESILRGALDAELKRDIAAATAYFDFNTYEIYQAIQTAQNQFKASQDAMDLRIKKYENMLQDITTDSIQIKTDNGQVRMGVWTILSQAREWDLEILSKISGLRVETTEQINQALLDFQNQLPIKNEIISEALEQLSNTPIIKNLDNLLNSTVQNVSNLADSLVAEAIQRTNDIISISQQTALAVENASVSFTNQLVTESVNRIEGLQRESLIRETSINALQGVIEDPESGLMALADVVDTMEVKVGSLGESLNSYAATLEGVQTVVKPLKASGSWKVSSTHKKATSYTLRSAQIEGDKVLSKRIDTLSATLADVTAEAIQSLTTQVSNIDGRVYANAESLNIVQTSIDGQSASVQQLSSSVNAISAEYSIKLDVNGLISGIGMMNDGSSSAFAVNAEFFYVGAVGNGKKPFMVLTEPKTINGVTYPAGTWIDTALIANATIGTAHIQDASITNAKIGDLDAAKITAGTLDANRIAANSISADKLTLGDTSNLWPNPYFDNKGVYPINSRTAWNNNIFEAQGNTIQLWGRDHIAPWSSRIPLKAGDTFVIEYIGGRNAGPARGLNAGLWVYDDHSNGGATPWQSVGSTIIADLGSGWLRFRHTLQVANNGSGRLAAYGCLYLQIDQAENAADPTYWSVGNLSIRRMNGGELIVNGSITSTKIQVDSLSAISANLGTMVSLKDQSKPYGARTVITGALYETFDDNNVRRVRLGYW